MEGSAEIKMEPPDSEGEASQIETEENTGPYEQVDIKVEKTEFNDLDIKTEEDIGHETPKVEVESMLVKVEPYHYTDSEGEIKYSKRKSTQPRTRRKTDSDDEYLPPKKKKKKPPIKQFRGKSKKQQDLIYSEEVISRIEVVTIDEEERQRELGETLNLRKHMPFTCAWCAVGFVLEDAYLSHMRTHHSPESGDHECDLCRARLKSASRLYRHRLRHYRRYRCMQCALLLKDKDAAAGHVMEVHAHTAFVCTQCHRAFKRPRYLERHIEQAHTKALQLECPECKRVFHERGRYRSHVRSHNEVLRATKAYRMVICAICDKQYKNKSCLKRHLRTHINTVCIFCCVPFENQEELHRHYKQTHNTFYNGGPRSAECPHCGRACVTPALLNKHIKRMHNDRTKKYQCEHCKRLYFSKGEVRSHILWSHERRGGHACALAGCGRVFRSPARLRLHTQRDHLRLATPRPHACNSCGKAFANKQILQRHMRVHSDEKYPCKECGMLFKTEPYVRVHYQLKHLNMTREQIKEEVKKRKAESINLVKPKLNKKQMNKLLKKNGGQNVTFAQNGGYKQNGGKVVDSFIPMFQTFVDVQRDILNSEEDLAQS